jgi:acyl carrier protein
MELEAEFGMDIDATESEHWETVNDIIEYID